MCGLAGWATNKAPSHNLVIDMAIASDLRGIDSWGMWLPETRQMIKGVGALSNNAWAAYNEKTVMMHSRHATTGAITAQNAHPFQFGNIIGMHNGMVYNHKLLNKIYGRKFPVDSMHIFKHIEEGRSFDDLNMYGAIVYDDGKCINFCRFTRGEFAVAHTSIGVFWMSDMKDLCEILMFHRLRIIDIYKPEANIIYEVEHS